jgi:hypothetical protein
VPVRGPLARVLLWSGAVGAGALAVVGGLSLRASGLVAVGLAGMLAACAAAGIARESSRPDRRSTIEAAIQAAGCAVGGLLVLAGIATLAGAVVAVLVGGAALAGWLVRLVLRDRSSGPGAAAPSVPSSTTGEPVAGLPARPPGLSDRTVSPLSGGLSAPVWTLTTPALGQEWLSTTAALAGRLEPTARQSLVGRRAETLDELERRDPDGFARWLAVGLARGSDPSDYVRGGPVHDGPAADTDAA